MTIVKTWPLNGYREVLCYHDADSLCLALKENAYQVFLLDSAGKEQFTLLDTEKQSDAEAFFQQTFSDDALIETEYRKMFPEGRPPLPERLKKYMHPGDPYGLYGKDVYWWYDTELNELNLFGSETVQILTYQRPDDAHRRQPDTIRWFLPRNTLIHRFVINKEIRFFPDEDVLNDDWGLQFERIRLMKTIKTLPRFTNWARNLRIPCSVKALSLRKALYCESGEHPHYAVQCVTIEENTNSATGEEDVLPLGVESDIFDALILEGKSRKLPDLDLLYSTNMFFTGAVVFYPPIWDRRVWGCYSETIMEYIRSRHPLHYSKDCPEGREFTDYDYAFVRRCVQRF